MSEVTLIPDELFSFQSCWTCDNCLLDIGIGSHTCKLDGHIIGDNFAVCKPTKCDKWKH